MTRNEFLGINDQPCRFKLKTGKEVFGVIWEKKGNENASYHFASLSEWSHRSHKANTVGMMICLDDIVGAELLSNSGSLVG